MIESIASQSKEAIGIQCSADDVPAATLITYVVEVGVTSTPDEPVAQEWKTATWSQPTHPRHPSAMLVIGPGAVSGVVLIPDTIYWTWVRVTGDGQSQVKSGGAIKATA